MQKQYRRHAAGTQPFAERRRRCRRSGLPPGGSRRVFGVAVVVVVRLDLVGSMAMLVRFPAVLRLIMVMLVAPMLVVVLRTDVFEVAAGRGVGMLVDVRVRVRMFVAVVVGDAIVRMGMRVDMGMRVLVLVTVFVVVGHACRFSLAAAAPRTAARVASAPATGLV